MPVKVHLDINIWGREVQRRNGTRLCPIGVQTLDNHCSTESAMAMPIFHSVPHCTFPPLTLLMGRLKTQSCVKYKQDCVKGLSDCGLTVKNGMEPH